VGTGVARLRITHEGRSVMEVEQFVSELVTQMNRNARVIDVQEAADAYRVRIAGTTGVVAACEVPREAMTAAATRPEVRQRLVSLLKRCADDTVATVPDGRA